MVLGLGWPRSAGFAVFTLSLEKSTDMKRPRLGLVIPGPEVIQPRFGVSFLAGELGHATGRVVRVSGRVVQQSHVSAITAHTTELITARYIHSSATTQLAMPRGSL